MTLERGAGGKRVVVLGGGYAGVLAAGRLARRFPRAKVNVTLVNVTDDFVERIRLHQGAVGAPPPTKHLSELLSPSGAEVRVGYAESIDLAQKVLRVRREGSLEALPFDLLIYALGSRTEQTTVPGASRHAAAVDDPLVASKLAALADGSRVSIVGGGLTGIELATEIAEAKPGLRVSLVSGAHPGAALSKAGRDYLEQTLASLGVELDTGETVREVAAGELIGASGRRRPFDLALWAAGFRVSPLAREAGLAVDGLGRVEVDEHLRSTSHDIVYAAGDATHARAAWGGALRMGCVTAMPMGATVADNVAARLEGAAETPLRFAFGGRCISLGRRRALVQLVRADDHPLELILTGSLAAMMKERLCRYTLRSLELEASGRWHYRWQKRGLAPAAPAVALQSG